VDQPIELPAVMRAASITSYRRRLMHRVRAAIPPAHPLARTEFATIRERLIKIAARVMNMSRASAFSLPTSGGRAVPHRRAGPDAVRPLRRGAMGPNAPPITADQTQTRCTAS
jgi:hypothetical protein